MDSGDTRRAFTLLRSLQPFKPKQYQSVRMADGTLAGSPEQCRERWREHFQTQLHGGPADLVQFQAMAASASEQARARPSQTNASL